MRRVTAAGALLLALLLVACGGGEEGVSELTVTRGSSSERVAVKLWRLPAAGRVVALGGVPGDLRVAQRLQLSRLTSAGDAEVLMIPPAGARLAALSRHGLRIGVEEQEGLRVGRVEPLDRGSTVLWSTLGVERPIVFDGHPARIYAEALWDLDVPRRAWFPETYGEAAALDPGQRWLAVGDEEGEVTVLSTEDGKGEQGLPRASEARLAAEISALAVSRKGEVFTLDRAGWVGCGSAAAPALPLAPPAMPAAIVPFEGGAWAVRGGTAVFVDCSPVPRRVCEVRGEEGDPRSASLLALDGRVYAAGVVIGAVVELPRCR